MGVKEKLTELYKGFVGSLDNRKNSGFSARKLTSIIVIVCIVLVHASWLKHAFLREDYEYMIDILVIDSVFVLLLLGIVTLEQVKNFKVLNSSKKKESKDENN